MKKSRPDLEVGMIIECDWNFGFCSSKYEYLYLGCNKTLKITENDRSQPLTSLGYSSITKIYSVDGKLSWNDYTGESGFGSRTLIWEKSPKKTELEIKKEALIEKANELLKQAEEL